MSQGDDDKFDIRSVCSRSSCRSNKSTTSIAALEARAKAEAARTRATFARKEIEYKVRQAQLKVEETHLAATLEALKQEQEAEAALAVASVFEAAAADEELQSNAPFITADEEPVSGRQLVSASEQLGKDTKGFAQDKSPTQRSPAPSPTTFDSHGPQRAAATPTGLQHPTTTHFMSPRLVHSHNTAISGNSPPQPRSHAASQGSEFVDLARYLAKRDLVTEGLTKFSDKPEDYWAWRASFKNTIKGLNLEPCEELDLLTRWLGNESSKHAVRIRSVHINDPTAGLNKAWERLEECYGTPEAIEKALLEKLEHFPKVSNRDAYKLRELGDLLSEVEAAKEDGFLPGLLYLDTARGIAPVVQKLPFNLQDKWMSEGTKYKQRYRVSFPPFSFFCNFIRDEARMRNDPSFKSGSLTSTASPVKEDSHSGRHGRPKALLAVHKTEVARTAHKESSNTSSEPPNKQCPIHMKPHPLKKCRAFREKPLDERKAFLKENNICFRCCDSSSHQARTCKAEIRCSECNSEKHIAALHAGPAPWLSPNVTTSGHGGEQNTNTVTEEAAATCTQVCGSQVGGRSCAKVCLVNVYPKGQPDKRIKAYAIMDDQSNRSLARSSLFDAFSIPMDNSAPYTLKTCTGVCQTTGRRASDFIIESADGQSSLQLPTLIECNTLPDNRSEIPTPEVAHAHAHLKCIAKKILPLDPEADLLLLLGRDIIQAHKVQEQLNGPVNAPFAQKLALGWVIVGEVCLGGAHKPPSVGAFKTNVLENGRPSHFSPCQNSFKVKERFQPHHQPWNMQSSEQAVRTNTMGSTIFQRSENDEKLAPSHEDQAFLQVMETGFYQDDSNSWVAPLPFRSPRCRLPNNRALAASRLNSLHRTLKKRPEMNKHFVDFMQGLFERGHAELAPPLRTDEECWYLPFFGVYHPQKPGNIRVVFDSSARYQGLSLNDVLLTGPNMNNSLVGVLVRFREESVAITVDIQQMFHCFLVCEEHRNFLRFLWYHDNDPGNEIVEYRMRVHVFGNSPSPAVAIFGLRKAACQSETQKGQDARCFVERNFYVDDGLKSVPTADKAISLLQGTQELLAASNLRLHKITSNSSEVMRAFPSEDLASGLKDLDFSTEFPPMQRSLGVSWDIANDTFTFQVSKTEKPYTRRGVLSTINSLFDPLGFAVPVSIQGRALLRALTSESCEWDEPLPETKRREWQEWKDSLKHLEHIKIPRPYTSFSLSEALHKELVVFCDASTRAIAAVAYMKVINSEGGIEVAFVFGRAKLVPKPEPTIPRLELCAAVLAIEVASMIQDEMDIQFSTTRFFSDSKVVLGYIHNESRRFHMYVNNRVQRIRRESQPEQWSYVPSDQNPADHGSRSLSAAKLSSSTWLKGPDFLFEPTDCIPQDTCSFELMDPNEDVEVRPLLTSTSHPSYSHLNSNNFTSFSCWRSLTRAIARLVHIAHSFTSRGASSACKGWHMCDEVSVSDCEQAKIVIIKTVQQEAFPEELKLIKDGKDLSKRSPLEKLSPYLDNAGLLRVGGRLCHSDLQSEEKNPLIMPRQHHVTDLVIRHFHERVQHQGRHLTEGAIRSAGFWILGGKRRICSLIHSCVKCRRLRGTTQTQVMADLPAERLSAEPPFSYVGVDVFGPWMVTSRRTRGGLASSKRWAVMFTCMSTRAVHLEVIESMDTSSFINALRRFFSVRGPVKQLRSDCGTNFVGACKELRINTRDATEPTIKGFLKDNGCIWVFNPPHASHMGGSWERMIGVARRILDSLLAQVGRRLFTHEVLTTFLAEVAAIMNARPLVPVSSDPDSPLILTPATLLTQKIGVLPAPQCEFEEKDLYKRQWRQVQSLANSFWNRWRKEYLLTLQGRRKWRTRKPVLQDGDVVLLKDAQAKRNHWPMGVVVKTYPSSDGQVRKVDVKIFKDGVCRIYLRPITDMVLLLSDAK